MTPTDRLLMSTQEPPRDRHPADASGAPLRFVRAEAAQSVFDAFIRVMKVASAHAVIAERLALANTTVHVHITDAPQEHRLTLLLDRTPIECVPRLVGNAEIELFMTTRDIYRFWTGELHLAMGIARGEVGYSGPVRKLLRVVPIARRLADDFRQIVDEEDFSVPDGISDVAQASPGAMSSGGPLEAAAEARSGFAPEQEALLDRAADFQNEYAWHAGPMRVKEVCDGDFWSIKADRVHKAFGRNKVLNGLEVGIPEGMITIILGPSGTGKSVLIKHLIGLMFPDQGDIQVHGRSIPDMRMSELLAMRKRFGILFQDGALFGSMNVYDNVAFPLRQHTDLSEEEITEIVSQRLSDVGLAGAGTRMPGELSGGMRKRAGFARALVLEPEIVLFDEPDSGLDPVRTALLCQLIEKIHAERGGTYVVITHDIASARRIGQYIAVLWKGRIVQAGDAAEMFQSQNPFVRQFLSGEPEGPLGME
jgi:phospholipid/cholesterol/gamma-HCH transport system ATP-binding protein